jgi:splicing factor U2AF subunit
MNGDSYSSRGMAPSSSSTKVKQKDGATTDKQASADSGRHGSSRDYPVSMVTIDSEMDSDKI